MPEDSPEAPPVTPETPSDRPAQVEKRPRTWFVPAVTATVLIVGFCLYYFVYVQSQREYLGNRNFRELAALGDQLQTMITVHGSILEFYADMASPDRHLKTEHRTKVDLNDILVIRPEDRALPKTSQLAEARKDYLKYLAPSFELSEPPLESVEAKEPHLQAVYSNARWILELGVRPEKGDKSAFRGSLVLADLFQPLVSSLPFDNILLAKEDGTIVYEQKRTGPQFTKLADLLENQTGAPATKPAGSSAGTLQEHSQPTHLTEIVLTGTHYKLFLQPVTVNVYSDDPSQHERAQIWTLAGLRSSASLEWEALAISYTFIIWLTVAFFVICMAGPILKLRFMNNRERLRLRELAFLGLFLVLLSGVFTLSGLEAAYFHSNDDDSDWQLQQLGDSLAGNIHRELQMMRDQLVALCQADQLAIDLHAAEDKEIVRRNLEASPSTGITMPYPNFNNAFWTDDDGHQVVKWSPGDYVTPMIDVSQLNIYTHPKTAYLDGKGAPFYFDAVLPPNRLEYLATLSMKTCDCNPHLCETGSRRHADIRGDLSGGLAFLTSQPFSLIDPVLPYGYGFALIDDTGLVLFHSDKFKSMRENFEEESDNNRELFAAAFGHSTRRSMRVKYLGKDYRARVVPIAGMSQSRWSLIVFRDLTSIRTLNLQSMTMASTLLLLVLAGPALFIGIWCLAYRPRFAPEWIWPNPARLATYSYQIALYTLLIIFFIFVGFRGSPEEIIIASAAVSYIALLLTFWCFRSYPAPGQEAAKSSASQLVPASLAALAGVVMLILVAPHGSHLKALALLLGVGAMAAVPLLNRPRNLLVQRLHHRHPNTRVAELDSAPPKLGPLSYRTCYAMSVLLLLLLIGVLTPLALFRASLSVERRLRIKQAQLHLAAALDQRQAAVVAQHEAGERADSAYGEFFRDLSAWREMGLAALFTTDGSPALQPHSPLSGDELYSGWFRGLIYGLHHDYNQTSAEMLGVIADRSDTRPDQVGPDWNWQNDGGSVTLNWHGAHPRSMNAPPGVETAAQPETDLIVRSEVPGFSGSDTVVAVGIAAAVMLVMGGLFWTLARKLFLFEVDPIRITGRRLLAESIRQGKNVLVLVPPVSDWKLEEPKFILDVEKLASGPKWAELLNLDEVPTNTILELTKFEHTTGDPEVDNQRVLLVRRLIQREKTQTVAVMRVTASPEDYRRRFPELEVIDLREEPFPWLKAYEGPARDLIWKECAPLPALWPIGAQLAKDLRNETIHSEDMVVSEILERADAYYRLMWHECSKDQKFALAQLAEDGLVNPQNGRALRQLVRRGLIVKDPQFRIMNESFRRFLQSAVTSDMRRAWLTESRTSGWGRAHGGVFTAMLIVGAFLLVTQNQLLQSSAAYITTALAALSTFAKLFGMVSGGGGQKPS